MAETIACFGELLLRLTAPGRELLLQSGYLDTQILLLGARLLGDLLDRLELLARHHVHLGQPALDALAQPALDLLADARERIDRAVRNPGQIIEQTVIGLHA